MPSHTRMKLKYKLLEKSYRKLLGGCCVLLWRHMYLPTIINVFHWATRTLTVYVLSLFSAAQVFRRSAYIGLAWRQSHHFKLFGVPKLISSGKLLSGSNLLLKRHTHYYNLITFEHQQQSIFNYSFPRIAGRMLRLSLTRVHSVWEHEVECTKTYVRFTCCFYLTKIKRLHTLLA